MSVDAKTHEGVGGRVGPGPGGPSLGPLLELSRDLRDALVPLQLEPQFRAELYRDLIVEGRQQEALRKLSLGVESPGSRSLRPQGEYTGRILRRLHLSSGQISRRWVVGAAAAGSAASLVGVGVVAYVRRRRDRRAA